MRIKIGIWTYEKVYSVDADDNKQEIMIDGQYVKYFPEFTQQVIGIVKNWPDKLDNYPGDSSRGIIYKVTYNDGSTERTMTGSHQTPDNFRELMNLIYNHRLKTMEEQVEGFDSLVKKYFDKRNQGQKTNGTEKSQDKKILEDSPMKSHEAVVRNSEDWDDVWY